MKIVRVFAAMAVLPVALAFNPCARAADPAEDALRATVRITRGPHSGTGFFVATREKGEAGVKHFLVTAAHVLTDIEGEKCTVVFRARGKGEEFVRLETDVVIRDGKKPLWVRHPDVDIAVLAVTIPDRADVKPFGEHQIASTKMAEERKVRVGQDVHIPCFPVTLEANSAGWPILRKGSIASHPLTPLASAKTIYVDYTNFNGDSGAPVVATIENEPSVVGLVIGMQRFTNKTSTPFEERTVHIPLGLAVVVQSPLISQTLVEWRKAAAKTDPLRQQ